MLLVLAGESLHVAVSEGRERVAVPPVPLPPDLTQLQRAEALGEPAERSACLDLGQLPVVADQDQLRRGTLGRMRKGGEVPGPGHPGLVDDQHRPGRQRHTLAEGPS